MSPEIEVIADEALDINFRKNLVFELNSWIKNLISVELKDLIGLIKLLLAPCYFFYVYYWVHLVVHSFL